MAKVKIKKSADKTQMTISCIKDEKLRWKIKSFCSDNEINLQDFVYCSILKMAYKKGIVTHDEAVARLDNTIWDIDLEE